MTRVRAFSLEGLTLWFWSNDHGDPPHFHAKKRGEWEVKVHLYDEPSIEVKVIHSGSGPTARQRKELLEGAREHLDALREEAARAICQLQVQG